MRKRWKFDPLPYVFAWFFGGLILWMVAIALWNGCDRTGCGLGSGELRTVGIVGLCLWLGPFALAFGAWAVVLGAPVLWKARPHRITEPVTDDLRKVSARSQQDQGER